MPVVTHMGRTALIAILMIPVKTDRFFLTFIQRLEQHFDERFRLGVWRSPQPVPPQRQRSKRQRPVFRKSRRPNSW